MTRCLNGEIKVGDTVVSISTEKFGGLIGVITEIIPLGSKEKETENENDDVYVNFGNDYSERRMAEILSDVRDLHQDPEKTWDSCGLDMVIMAPDMLLKIDLSSLPEHGYEKLLDSETAVSRWCIAALLNRDRVEVETPFGQLFAEVVGDPTYPGIYLGLRDNEDNLDKTFALAEATSDHPADNKHSLRLLVWRDMDDGGDYSNDFTFLECDKE